MKKRIFTPEEIEKVIYNYEVLHMGQKKAGAEFHMNDRMVKRLLEENGVYIKSIQETNVSRYEIDEEFFDTESEDMAYILGLLASDGYISSRDNKVCIELQDSDSEILERINSVLKNKREVKHYITERGYKNCKLYFYSAHIKQALGCYKIIPNKTYDENYGFPINLNKKFWKDYIRGLFDGDGSIKMTENSITFQIDSSCRDIVDNIQKYFSENYNIELNIQTQTPNENNNRTINLYRIYAYGEKAKKVMEILYDTNSSLYLQRKKDKYLSLIKI